MVAIRTILLTNNVVVAILSFSLNFLLLYLICKRTPRQLKLFSRLMLVHCCSDLLLVLSHLLVEALVLPLGTHNFLVTQGIFTHLNELTTRIFHSYSVWINLTAVALLPIDFYYRHQSVCFNRELSTKTIAVLVFCAYFYVFLYAFPLRNLQPNLVFGPSEKTANLTVLLEQFSDWKDQVPSYLTTLDQKNPVQAACFFAILSVNLFTFVVIAYTSIRIHLTLKKRSQNFENVKTKRLHKQVTRILIVQACLPIIIICGPIATLYYCAVTSSSSPTAGLYSSLSAAWLSVIKPLATVISIENYRRFLFGCLVSKRVNSERRSWHESTMHVRTHS